MEIALWILAITLALIRFIGVAELREWVQLSAPLVFGSLCALLAWARLGPYPL